MKKICKRYLRFTCLWVAVLSWHALAVERFETNVAEVGLSHNTNSVFVRTVSSIAHDDCGNQDYFRLSLDHPSSYMLYSAALTALNENKKMRFQYSVGECLSDSHKIEVFWNLPN